MEVKVDSQEQNLSEKPKVDFKYQQFEDIEEGIKEKEKDILEVFRKIKEINLTIT